MYQIGICDDDKAFCNNLAYFVNAFAQQERLSLNMKYFYSGETLIDYMEDHPPFHLLFLDIEFQGINGVGVGKIIRKKFKNEMTQIVFVSVKEIYGVSEHDFRERMEFFHEVLGLQEFIHSTVRTLSLGQRMRADLAAALLHNPRVLYLDEPTIGLDVVVKDKIRRAIREINETYHTTVILTTHDLNDIEELCQRIIIIDAGKKIYDTTLELLKKEYGSSCCVCFEWKEKADAAQLSKLQDMGAALEFTQQDKGAKVQFDKKDYTVADVISKVMEIIEVKDVQIKETELTDIVKKIYQRGVRTEQ